MSSRPDGAGRVVLGNQSKIYALLVGHLLVTPSQPPSPREALDKLAEGRAVCGVFQGDG